MIEKLPGASSRTAEDTLAIHELVVRYGFVLDDQDWDGFRQIFTDDAVLDFGGGRGNRHTGSDQPERLAPIVGIEEIIRNLRDVQTHPYQHILASHLIEDQGPDEVIVRSKALFPIPGQLVLETVYRDLVVRTSSGWRIRHKSVGGYRTDPAPWMEQQVARWRARGAIFE